MLVGVESGEIREEVVTAKEGGVSFWNYKNVLKSPMMMVAKLCEYQKPLNCTFQKSELCGM